jgi:hypothetical protein
LVGSIHKDWENHLMASIVERLSGVPMGSVSTAMAAGEGVEEEYLIEGVARRFRLADGVIEHSVDGRWRVEPADEAAFCTRILVVRPADPSRFAGTVIVHWNVVSAGEAFLAGAQAAQLVRDGFAIVGVSAQYFGIEGRHFGDEPEPGSPPSLKGHDPLRYARVEHPGDDFSYDIFTQVGKLVGPSRPRHVDPLSGFDVRHTIASGPSQSAGRLAAYLNGVRPLASEYDAFLLLVYMGAPNAINAASAPVDRTGGLTPGNRMHYLDWRTYRLREDLEVPVIVLNSEFEAARTYPQEDTEYLRWWEIPGAGHAGSGTPEQLEELAASGEPMSTVSFAPAVRSAYHTLRRWLDGGPPPPFLPRLRNPGDHRTLARDEHGNALGGIRWPDVEAPLATHVSDSEDLFQMRGNTTPFSPEKIRSLYPDRSMWFERYKAAVERLIEQEVVLADDARRMLERGKSQRLPIGD